LRIFAPDDLSVHAPVFVPLADATERARVLAFVHGHWADLGPTAPAVGVALGGGMLRRNLLVGIGNKRYVLKRVEGPQAARRLAEEQTVEHHLRRHDVPVVRSVPTDKGAGFVTQETFAWVLHCLASGNHFTGVGRELDAAASTFARLMRACALLPSQAFTDSIGKIGARLRAFLEAPAFGDRLLPHRQALLEAGEATERLRPLTEQTSAVVHLDYHPGNLLLEQERVTCVLDLEDVVTYPVLPALGFAAFKLIRQSLVDETVRAAERTEPMLATRWLDSWHAQVPFPERTLSDLRAGAEYRVLALIELILDDCLRRGDPELPHEFDKQMCALYEMNEAFGPRQGRTT
jgi:Ser/Thr protein kinase RdoA (MazF antagonist)